MSTISCVVDLSTFKQLFPWQLAHAVTLQAILLTGANVWCTERFTLAPDNITSKYFFCCHRLISHDGYQLIVTVLQPQSHVLSSHELKVLQRSACKCVFTHAALAMRGYLAVIVSLCVCLCVTRRYCIKTTKHRIMQTTPRSFLTPKVVGGRSPWNLRSKWPNPFRTPKYYNTVQCNTIMVSLVPSLQRKRNG